MIPFDLPIYLAIPYWLGFAVCWRSLTGHMAWSVHRTAKHNPTVRPPMENWVASAVPCFFLSLVWFAVVLFTIHWPHRRGAELEGEVELRRMTAEHIQLENQRHEKLLGIGDVEVLDDD